MFTHAKDKFHSYIDELSDFEENYQRLNFKQN